MRHPILGRAGAMGIALSLVVATVAFADTVTRDADTVTAGMQSSRDLGEVAPGAILDVPIDFALVCANTQHVGPDQAVVVEVGSTIVPDGGAVAMDAVTLGLTPETWPVDGEACTGDEEALTATGSLAITAPLTVGPHEYSIIFDRTPSTGISGVTAATFYLNVVEPVNTPPTLNLPGDMTVVADGPDGWTAHYEVSATDAEDDPDPTPTCAPAVGEVLPLGTTTVECSVADSGGLTATGSFDITVEPASTDPEPEPDPAGPLTAVFGPPVKANGLDGRAGRTIPLKVRLMADESSIGEGSLVVVVTACEGGDPVAEVAMHWRSGPERWHGLLRTRGLEAGCYDVRAVHDGSDVGGFELRLFDHRPDVAREKSAGAGGPPAQAGATRGGKPDHAGPKRGDR